MVFKCDECGEQISYYEKVAFEGLCNKCHRALNKEG